MTGCATTSAEPGANAFVQDHAQEAMRAAAATRAVVAALSKLSAPPTRPQLEGLALLAERGRREDVPATEWSAPEKAEEEDLEQAEIAVIEGADELSKAMAGLRAYAHAPQAASLYVYRHQLASGREKWDEGISELWYLAHRAKPPTI